MSGHPTEETASRWCQGVGCGRVQNPVLTPFCDFGRPQLEKSRDDPHFSLRFPSAHAPLQGSSEFGRDRAVIEGVRAFPPFF